MAAIYTTPRTWAAGEVVTASLLNTHLRDMMDYFKARPVARVSDLDGTVGSTTSTSFVDITGATVNITTSGSSSLLIMASGSWNGSGATNNGYITALVDGVNQGDATNGMTGLIQYAVGNGSWWGFTYVTSAAVSNGAHTVKLQFRTSAGVTCIITTYSLAVMEVF